MKVVVYSCSPKNETSLTYHSMKFLQANYPEDEFDLRLVGGHTKVSDEDIEALKKSDVVFFVSSLFHFCIPQQMMLYLEDMYAKCPDDFKSKPCTLYMTSGKIMDITGLYYVENFFKANGIKYLRFLSQYDVSILSEEGRLEICAWYQYIRDAVTGPFDVKFADSDCNVRIVDCTDGTNQEMNKAIEEAQKDYETRGANSKIIRLRDYKILGCTACFNCYTTRVCTLNKADDWVKSFHDIYEGTDIIVFMGELHYGMIGTIHKPWLDRHVQGGRFPADAGIITDYVVADGIGTDAELKDYRIHAEAMCGFGGDVISSVGRVSEQKEHIRNNVLLYNNNVQKAENFLGVGCRLKFANLAIEIKNMTPDDNAYFESHGDYKPRKPNPLVMPVYTPEDGQKSKSGRLVPYRAAIINAKTMPTQVVKTRQRMGYFPGTEYVPKAPAKKKLFGRK